MITEYEVLTETYGPLSPEDYREFRDWNRGNPGDVHVAYRYCMFGLKPKGGVARNWRELHQTEIVIYPALRLY